MTATSKRCNLTWPNTTQLRNGEPTLHGCLEPAGHEGWHVCPDGARLDPEKGSAT